MYASSFNLWGKKRKIVECLTRVELIRPSKICRKLFFFQTFLMASFFASLLFVLE